MLQRQQTALCRNACILNTKTNKIEYKIESMKIHTFTKIRCFKKNIFKSSPGTSPLSSLWEETPPQPLVLSPQSHLPDGGRVKRCVSGWEGSCQQGAGGRGRLTARSADRTTLCNAACFREVLLRQPVGMLSVAQEHNVLGLEGEALNFLGDVFD